MKACVECCSLALEWEQANVYATLLMKENALLMKACVECCSLALEWEQANVYATLLMKENALLMKACVECCSLALEWEQANVYATLLMKETCVECCSLALEWEQANVYATLLMKETCVECCSLALEWEQANVYATLLMKESNLALEWEQANVYATLLMKESKWSRTTYAYQKCSILLMSEDALSTEVQESIDTLMKNLPRWKKRVAGKSLPMEKFCIKKSERYWAQDRKLVLPVFELLYVWNMFKVLGKKWSLVEAVFIIVDKTLNLMNSGKLKISSAYEADNRGLLLLLKGGCLHQMNSPLQAEECLNSVLTLEKKIKEDHYLVPYALVQLGIIHFQQGAHQKAIQILEDAKKNYTGYSLESRLHFQIHSALLELNSKDKKGSHDVIESTHM
ncbi:Tetratricopeptide repeat protein 39B [Homalodisca vitripennis]|nr:Tetratricopeptide repeat protein 39B [Homalodisca vitripennis]